MYLAPTGSDSNSGTYAAPFLTLERALQGAGPGTRVILEDGTYPLTSAIYLANLNGTPAEPIVIAADVGATPILDASGVTNLAAFTNVFVVANSSYVFIDGLTVANSSAGGIQFDHSSFITLTRSTVHDVQDYAILVIGSDFVVAGCEVFNAALMNENDKNGSWWSGTAGSWYVDSTTPTQRVRWLENHIHDTWGECINVLFADDVDVIGNDLHDCYSDHVYIDHGANVRVLRNRMYNTEAQLSGPGVGVDDENYEPDYPATLEDNLLIANNDFGPNLSFNLIRWETSSTARPNNTWSHLHVLFNVMAANPIWFQAVGGGTAPSDGVMAGNIIQGSPSITFQDSASWTVADNDFASGVPSAWTGNGNFSVVPQFAGPTDGSTLSGFQTANAAALGTPSRAEVPEDAFCAARNATTTAAGLSGP